MRKKMTKRFNGRHSPPLSPKTISTTSASSGVVYRVRPVRGGRTQVVVHNTASGRRNYRESIPTPNNLERFIGIWSDLSEDDERLFNEIFAERKTHFDRPLLALFDE
jgi:hypothetical protein